MTRRRATPALLSLACVTALVLGGCTGRDGSSSSSSAAERPSTVTTSRSVTTTSLSLAPSTDGFTADTTTQSGRGPGGAHWDFTVPQVAGGDRTVRRAFNSALEMRADRVIDDARSGEEITVTDGELFPAESSHTVVARTTLSGALITVGMAAGGAYPHTAVQTVVVEAGAGRILTFDDVFADPAQTRSRLAGLVRTADTSGRLSDPAVPIAPDDLRQWIALDDGLHLYVPVPHVLGDLVPVTIPWPQLADAFSATGRILFLS